MERVKTLLRENVPYVPRLSRCDTSMNLAQPHALVDG